MPKKKIKKKSWNGKKKKKGGPSFLFTKVSAHARTLS
jgi:hypothetical protein